MTNKGKLLEARAIIFSEKGVPCSEFDIFVRASRVCASIEDDSPHVAYGFYQRTGILPFYVSKFCDRLLDNHSRQLQLELW